MILWEQELNRNSFDSPEFLWLLQVINIVSAKIFSIELMSSFQESINSYYVDAFPLIPIDR